METLKDVISEITKTRTQTSACAKDETKVMKAMLNDPTYKVDVYGRNGVEGSFCPYEESRLMIANIIRDTTKIGNKEATELANTYEFGKQESNIMINLSKEFINSYIETGRKLPLGGRERSNISIAKKEKEAKPNKVKIGVNDDGSDKYDDSTTILPAHGSLRVYSSCPSWLK